MTPPANDPFPEVILGNANRRFSGVTSTMLQVLAHQQDQASLVVLGAWHLPSATPRVQFFTLLRQLRSQQAKGRIVVFHARRNNEMIQGLILRFLARCTVRLLFTSTAQRHHTQFTRWLMKQMDSVISTCKAAADYLETSPEKLIPHGIDTERYQPALEPVALPADLLTPAQHYIGIFGRVRVQKGVDVLVNAALPLLACHRDWALIIVGEIKPAEQPFVNGLKQQAERAGVLDRVVFTGPRPFEELPRLFACMSIVTALSRNEGFGLTVLEAMSSARAVIASRAGAWPDILTPEEDGLLVDIGDVPSTEAALKRLITDGDLRSRLAANARQTVLDRYAVETEAQTLLDHYRALAQA